MQKQTHLSICNYPSSFELMCLQKNDIYIYIITVITEVCCSGENKELKGTRKKLMMNLAIPCMKMEMQVCLLIHIYINLSPVFFL